MKEGYQRRRDLKEGGYQVKKNIKEGRKYIKEGRISREE
jgi:hypothetical protein